MIDSPAAEGMDKQLTANPDSNSLPDSLEEPEVQVVLVAVEEAPVVGEDQPSGVVAPADVFQLDAVLVPTGPLVTHVFPSGPEATAALVQSAVNLTI